MEKRKPLHHYIRILHRDLGFFLIGFLIIYSLSGIMLVYRNTDFLKQEKRIEKNLKPGMDPEQIAKELRMRDLKITSTEGDLLYFQEGTYNKKTGVVIYTSKELPTWLNEMNKFHKSDGKNPIGTIFGVLLLLMGISSFWMFRPGSNIFRRGIYIGAAGIIISIVVLSIL